MLGGLPRSVGERRSSSPDCQARRIFVFVRPLSWHTEQVFAFFCSHCLRSVLRCSTAWSNPDLKVPSAWHGAFVCLLGISPSLWCGAPPAFARVVTGLGCACAGGSRAQLLKSLRLGAAHFLVCSASLSVRGSHHCPLLLTMSQILGPLLRGGGRALLLKSLLLCAVRWCGCAELVHELHTVCCPALLTLSQV